MIERPRLQTPLTRACPDGCARNRARRAGAIFNQAAQSLTRGAVLTIFVIVATLVAPAVVEADTFDTVNAAIGLTSLQQRLGAEAPTGSGINVAQVEAGLSGQGAVYMPSVTHPELIGATIVDVFGGGSTSSHATAVARSYYGTRSPAPGISHVDVFEANRWLDDGYLRTQTANAPLPSTGRVQNHSWVLNRDGNSSNDAQEDARAIDALRRLDFAINRDGVIAVVGVENGAGSAMPLALANAYNVIAVGQSNGGSSAGPSTLDQAGRVRPDLVAPGDFPSATATVSRAVPRVAAAAALLLETAGSDTDATRPETIKALLLAGATKNEFDLDHNTSTNLDDWSHTSTQPLDLRYGAGELNIDNSHRILTAGQQGPSSAELVDATGWDLTTIGGTQRFFFRVPQGTSVDSLSAIATWNRQISFAAGEGSAPATLTPNLANVDLRLYPAQVSSNHLQYQVSGPAIDQSVSALDNVEHVFHRALAPGLYALELTTNQAADVALAWDTRLTTTATSSLAVSMLGASQIRTFDAAAQSSVFADSGDGLLSPLATAYDGTGRLYVADTLHSRVVRFDSAGVPTVITSLGSGINTPSGLAIAPNGDLYVSSYLTNTIHRVDNTGQVSLLADASDGVLSPFGLAIDPQGRLVAASLGTQQILRFDSAGNPTVLADASDGLFTPIDVAVDASGELFVADVLKSRVWRLDAAGNLSTFADLNDGLASPTALAFNPDGDLFVTNYLTNSIVRVDPLGNGSTWADATNGVTAPWGLDFAPLASTSGAGSQIAGGAFSGGASVGSGIAAVPEPGSLLLAAAGFVLLALGALRRRSVAR